MYKFKNSATAVLGVLTLITVCTVALPFAGYQLNGPTAGAAPTPSTQNVKVVNTSLEPVPVSAQQNGVWNVGIDGTNNTVKLAAGTTVPAQQSGAWNVGINGTPTVGIDQANNTVKVDPATPVWVRDADNPARQASQAYNFGGFLDGEEGSHQIELAPIPAGKTYVIEYVSIRASMLVGQKLIDAVVLTRHNGITCAFYLPITFVGSDGSRDFYVASQQVRLYGDAGGAVDIFARRNSSTGANTGALQITVSGYYVDMP